MSRDPIPHRWSHNLAFALVILAIIAGFVILAQL